LQAVRAGDGDDAGIDAGAGEGLAMEAGRIVFAELADVTRREAQVWQATTVVAAWPPGRTVRVVYSTLEPRSG